MCGGWGRGEHQFCRPEGGGPARPSGGGGGRPQSPQPIPSKVRFLSNKESGRPGRPHWGVRFLFCTRNLSWWGRPRGGCRAGLFSETRERRRKGTRGVEGGGQGGRVVENQAWLRGVHGQGGAGASGSRMQDGHVRRSQVTEGQRGAGGTATGDGRDEACGRDRARACGRGRTLRKETKVGQRGAVHGKGPHPELGSVLLVL